MAFDLVQILLAVRHQCQTYDEGYHLAAGEEISGTLLISTMTISGIEWENRELNPYREFLNRQPKAVIGGSALVYEGSFDTRKIAAVQHIVMANRLSAERKFAEARSEAREAITITPRSLRAHLALGTSLAGLNQTAEAKQELETRFADGPRLSPSGINQIAEAQRELRKLGSPE